MALWDARLTAPQLKRAESVVSIAHWGGLHVESALSVRIIAGSRSPAGAADACRCVCRHVRGVVSPAEAVINVNLKEQTAHVLRTLTPREEKVIKMRFGLEDGSEHTLEEVGQSFAVTRERIRQIEAKALRKLRHPSRSRKLRAFMDGVRD